MSFPMMISKGRVLVWSAALVLLLVAAAHAADFTGPVVSILDGDTIEVLTTPIPHVSASAASTVLRKAKPLATERSKPCLHSSSEKMSSFRPTDRTNMGARSLRCSCPMALTSITSWSKTAGAGGIGNMRL